MRGGVDRPGIGSASSIVTSNLRTSSAVDDRGGVRLLDLGVALIPGSGRPRRRRSTPGSQGYIAPELYKGSRGTEASDQFALGVTTPTACLLAAFWVQRSAVVPAAGVRQSGRSNRTALRHLKGVAGLATALRRTVQVRPEDRFEDINELLHMLEKGWGKSTPRPTHGPLAERNPVLLWQLIALALGLALIAALTFR